MKFKVNANYDAMMDPHHPVDKIVELVKINKGGLYHVKDEDGNIHILPKRNLDKIGE